MFQSHLVRALGILLAALLFSIASGAYAQEIRATKLWYGLYDVKGTKEIADPKSPTGKRYESSDPTPPARNSSDIVLRNRIYFGFGYRISGNGVAEELYFLPNADGTRSDTAGFRFDRNVVDGEQGFMGWHVADGDLKAIKLGTWTFQLRHRGRVLVEHTFTLTDR
jgi:hypothetical protein